jgi:ribosomal protein L36
MLKHKNTSDGLIGMWAHTFDEDGDIDQQFQIIRRSGDVYICRIYSWEDGRPTNCTVIRRNRIFDLKLYESSEAMNVALEKHEQERWWNRPAVDRTEVIPNPRLV